MTRRGRRTDATPAPGAPVRGRRLWVSGAVVALLVTLGTVLFFLSQPAGASRVLADGTRIRFLGTSGPIGTDLILGSRLEGWLLRPEPAPAAQPALPRSLLRRSVLNSDRLVQSVTPLPSPRTFTGIPGLAGPRAASGRPRAVALRTTQDPGGLTIWCWLEGPSPGSPSSRRTNGRPDAELVRPIPLVAEVVDEAGRSGWSWPGSVRYGASLGRTNRECLVASWVPWYPRRSRILRLRLHRPARRGSGPLAEFRIPNPAAQTYPRWTPTPLPARARNGPLQVALERLSVAREE
ncbi:MAG: hypothetical protein FJX77_08940, partial [Armatimonadetes bacterium]|nr:hypothetical protein [Armatimonadota bacterium]